jgi:hypothetical protein
LLGASTAPRKTTITEALLGWGPISSDGGATHAAAEMSGSAVKN